MTKTKITSVPKSSISQKAANMENAAVTSLSVIPTSSSVTSNAEVSAVKIVESVEDSSLQHNSFASIGKLL